MKYLIAIAIPAILFLSACGGSSTLDGDCISVDGERVEWRMVDDDCDGDLPDIVDPAGMCFFTPPPEQNLFLQGTKCVLESVEGHLGEVIVLVRCPNCRIKWVYTQGGRK